MIGERGEMKRCLRSHTSHMSRRDLHRIGRRTRRIHHLYSHLHSTHMHPTHLLLLLLLLLEIKTWRLISRLINQPQPQHQHSLPQSKFFVRQLQYPGLNLTDHQHGHTLISIPPEEPSLITDHRPHHTPIRIRVANPPMPPNSTSTSFPGPSAGTKIARLGD